MTTAGQAVRTVVKVGGGLLARAGAFELVTGALTAFAKGRPALVVPGGGPFASAVRELLRRIKIGDEAAHWMAVLGMDQYAHALAERTAGAVLVEQRSEIHAALEAGRVPVLAPYRWLRAADPLPHSWDVTSDSVSAWVAGALGATRLVLIKPVKGDPPKVVDVYFFRALPRGVDVVILAPHELDRLGEVLDEGPIPGEWRPAREG
jgi:aspartokinase-like uncharacterized kinase